MNRALPMTDMLAPLSLAVPGWQGRMVPEAVAKIARGVAIEQERLRGGRLLVVVRRHELDHDGITEWIQIVSSHTDVQSAAAVAQHVGTQQLLECVRRRDPKCVWTAQPPSAREWPAEPPCLEGTPLPGFIERRWDGLGWGAVEIAVAIFPTDPDKPINAPLMHAIGLMSETASWFEGVVDTSDQHRRGASGQRRRGGQPPLHPCQ